MTPGCVTRRKFLNHAGKTVLATSAIFLTGLPIAAAAVNKQDRQLRFFNTHTGEKLSIVYRRKQKYVISALGKLDILMRDHRADETKVMDPRLYDQLWHLQQIAGGSEIFEIISGYRSPATNKILRSRSSGVAKRSYHMFGRAVDIRLRGTKISHVRKIALALNSGGVGYYPSSDFVHIDTGPVRSWS